MVLSVGNDPTTFRLKGGYSSQLSYDSKKWCAREELNFQVSLPLKEARLPFRVKHSRIENPVLCTHGKT